jgi:hypothetical protein
MALIRVERDKPEVVGGNTYAYVAEESLAQAIENGWRRVDGKAKEEKKEDPKPVKEEVVKSEEVAEEKPVTKKAKKSL